MKEHTVVYKTWLINEHPNKENVFNWIRENWHDLGQFEVDEFVECFKNLAKYLGTTCDYRVSIFPDRGEYLKLGEFDKSYIDDLKEDTEITGWHWDYTFIEALQEGNINHALNNLHAQGEFLYSDEGLEEMCEANQYEFLENGKLY